MKKGFTLVEMLIVVVIVGILMLIWLWLNRNQLAQLKAATVVEEVHTSFDEIFLQILNSSSHQAKDPNNPHWPWITKPYSALELVITPKDSDLAGVNQTSQSDMPIKIPYAFRSGFLKSRYRENLDSTWGKIWTHIPLWNNNQRDRWGTFLSYSKIHTISDFMWDFFSRGIKSWIQKPLFYHKAKRLKRS